MGVITSLVAVGFFVVVVMVALQYFPNLFGSLLDDAGEFYTATKLLPNTQTDDIICDLRIKTKVALDEKGGLFAGQYFKIDPIDSHSYNWYNCVAPQNYASYNFFDAGFGKSPDPELILTNNLTPNTFIQPFDTVVTQQIAIVDANDPTQRVDWILRNNLSYKITIPAGVVETPLRVDAEFVISDIPLRAYTLEIYVDPISSNYGGINSLPKGEPFRAKICDNFHNLIRGQCQSITP